MAFVRALVCAATLPEARAVERGIRGVVGSTLAFEVLRTGMGLRAARRTLERELFCRSTDSAPHGSSMPDLIISTGFAGTLDAQMVPGSWVLGDHVLLWLNPPRPGISVIAPGGTVAVDWLKPAADALGARGSTVLSSPLLVAYDPTLNEVMSRRQGPVAVDMESAALAEVARRYGVPFAVLRLVTDTPDQPLPGFVYGFANALSFDARLTVAARARHAARGAVAVATRPQDLIRFVQASMDWGKTLESGWRRIAAGGR